MHVGFLGIGAMGTPMAKRLRGVFSLTVYNRNPERARAFEGIASKTPQECVRDANVLVAMLADAHALDEVLSSVTLKRDAVLIDMSTSGRRAAIAFSKRVPNFVDAPVSGTVGPAERGELLAFAGASKENLERVRPVLDRMCHRILHVGDVGQGQAMKVALNGIGAHHLVAFTSMLALAERAGIPRAIAVEAFTQGAFATPSYIGKKQKVLAKDWSPQFSLDLTKKDLDLNLEIQNDVGLVLPVTRAIEHAIERGIEKGLGEKDLFSLRRDSCVRFLASRRHKTNNRSTPRRQRQRRRRNHHRTAPRLHRSSSMTKTAFGFAAESPVAAASAMADLTLGNPWFIAAGPELLAGIIGASRTAPGSTMEQGAAGGFFSIAARTGLALGNTKDPKQRRAFTFGLDFHLILTPYDPVIAPMIALGYDQF